MAMRTRYDYVLDFTLAGIWVAYAFDVNRQGSVLQGIEPAQTDFKQGVLDAMYHTLSAVDIRFLETMLPDEGASMLADIAACMGVKSNCASRYRIHLEEQSIILEWNRGVVGFDLPLFKENVAEMAD